MRYAITHVTRFSYASPISESVMEVRMQPRSDGLQRTLRFGLSTLPAARVLMYQDHDGNIVHHFDIPGRHSRLTLTAEALVDREAPPEPPASVDGSAWVGLDALAETGEHWEFLAPSAFARPTPLLLDFAGELRVARHDDPMSVLRHVTREMYSRLEYSPRSTRVDSPIDDALAERRGVCQDFAHIFIALARGLGVPARYVSGYLFHEANHTDRSPEGATHAWAEIFLPDMGWIGIDPTNNIVAGERHVRVAIGRDYADVPPTRGVFKGTTAAKSELAVSVRVAPVRGDVAADPLPFAPWLSQEAPAPLAPAPDLAAIQQQ